MGSVRKRDIPTARLALFERMFRGEQRSLTPLIAETGIKETPSAVERYLQDPHVRAKVNGRIRSLQLVGLLRQLQTELRKDGLE